MFALCYVCHKEFEHRASSSVEAGTAYICIPCLKLIPEQLVYGSKEQLIKTFEPYDAAKFALGAGAITIPNIDREICPQCRGFHLGQ